VRAHDAGLRPQKKKKKKKKKKHRGSRATQRGLGRHGSIENWEMVRVVWATWNGTKPFLGRTLGIVGDSSSERFVKVYLQ
jgi:hypothetical protein